MNHKICSTVNERYTTISTKKYICTKVMASLLTSYEGLDVGLSVDGELVGDLLGLRVGLDIGLAEGESVGTLLGEVVGCNIEKIYDACM